MAFESLDFDTKVYEPTKALIYLLKQQFAELWQNLQTCFIDLHARVAALGLEWHKEPLATSQRWYDEGVNSANEVLLYVNSELVPQLQTQAGQFEVTATRMLEEAQTSLQIALEKGQENLAFFAENPTGAAVAGYDSMIVTLEKMEAVSSDVLSDVGVKLSALLELLAKQPIETLESAWMEAVNAFLNAYFELISVMLDML